jgi:putative flavoprotein involved in K+ transport
VIIASGLYQKPKIPAYGANLPADIVQVASGQYRNPQALPEGAVLVVGSSQSGCQIAEELYQAGRKVYLCTGTAGRAPRRYRGKDIFEWLALAGYLDRTPEKLPSLRARFAGNPQVSGKDGGHTLNVHQFYRDGVTLLGHIQGAQDGRVYLAPDLKTNLAKMDEIEGNILKLVDEYIARNNLDAPVETIPVLRDGYDGEEITQLDLKSAGIRSVIWAMGYSFDFSLVKLPVTDEFGFPQTDGGVTRHRGLYFAGMPWLNTQRTGILLGISEHARSIAEHITRR